MVPNSDLHPVKRSQKFDEGEKEFLNIQKNLLKIQIFQEKKKKNNYCNLS